MLNSTPKIGLALGGGFARGIAHVGVLRVLEQHRIPLHCISGVSAGAMVAAAFASGATADEIGRVGSAMRFTDVARWTVSRMGLAGSDRMAGFLKKLLKQFQFESMRIPLGVVATDLASGQPAMFYGSGDVVLPVRASCSYPGLFQPVRCGDRLLVDGGMSMDVPAQACRELGATRVISVHLPMQDGQAAPSNMFEVVNRCFQIMSRQKEDTWRKMSDLVLSPEVRQMSWNAFTSAEQLIEAGEQAAREVLPQIQAWLAPSRFAEPRWTSELAACTV
jgi:NTE family protein